MEVSASIRTIQQLYNMFFSSMLQYKNERQHLKTWHLLQISIWNSLISCCNGKNTNSMVSNSNWERLFFPKIKLKLLWFSLSLPPSLSSADLAQPVVRPRVGYDGLNGNDGLVDLGLELPQLLDVQQAQDLSRFVQSGIWEETYFTFP